MKFWNGFLVAYSIMNGMLCDRRGYDRIVVMIDHRISKMAGAMLEMAMHFHLKGAAVGDAEHMLPPSQPPRYPRMEPSNILRVNGSRVAVKALPTHFTSKKDFGEEFVVCGQHEHEQNPCKLYVQVSNDQQYAAIVKADTRTKWFPVSREPWPAAGFEEGFQICPIEHVQFVKLEKAS